MNRQLPSEVQIVRRATESDARDVARIYNLHVDARGVTFDTDPWGLADTAARLTDTAARLTDTAARLADTAARLADTAARLGQSDPDGWYVAEDHRGITGWASVRRFSERHGYRYSCESAIYLDPVAYGQGVADALQRRIHSHCGQFGIHHAVARIVTKNARSIAFHERYGYRVVGVQHEIGRIDDQWVDVTIMEKIFAID
jgi:L-amino acid N-acyltransferase YncA